MNHSLHILLLEDNFNDAKLIHHRVLKSDIKFEWLHVYKWDEFTTAINDFKPDVILSDYNLGGFTGVDALEFAKKNCPLIPFIIVTGTLNEETAADTIKKGAWDYVVKERLMRLNTAIKNTLLLKTEKENYAIAQENLRINEERYMLSVEGSNDGIWDRNLKTNEVHFSVRWKEMLGYKDHELENHYNTWEKLLHPDDMKLTLSKLDEHLNKKTSHYKVEFRLKCKDGSYKWILARGKASFDKDGLPYRIAGSHTDISERKRAEEKLRQSYMFNDYLLKTIPFGMHIIDESGTVLYQNDIMKKISGKDGAGQKCWELNKDDHTQCPKCPLHNGIAIGETSVYEAYNVLGNRIFEISHAGMMFDDKKVILEIFQDITHKKHQELVLAARIRLIDYAVDYSMKELLRKFLDEVELLTQSKIGFFHFVNSDQETLMLQTWSTNTLKNLCKAKLGEENSHYPVSKAGIWVDCIHQRKSVIHNNYESIATKNGLPEGHVPMIRELVIPIFRDDKIVAVIGVGNKPIEYTNEDVLLAEQLAELAWEIIDRKQAGEDLKKNEVELDAIFNNAPLSMMLVDGKRQIIKINTAALAMSNSAKEVIIGSFVGESIKCIHATDHPQGCGFGKKCANCNFKNTIVKTFETGQTFYRSEVKISHKQHNKTIDSHLLLSTSIVNENESKLVLVCLEDITQRRQAKEALKRSEELLSDTGRLAKVGGWELDIKSMKTSFTEETYRIHALPPNSPAPSAEEAINFYAPEAQIVIEEAVNKAIKYGENYDIEAPFINAKGEHIWIRTIGNALYDGPKIVRLFGSIQDITERKKTEEELIKHRDHLELIVSERTENLKKAIYELQEERDKAQRYLDIADVILMALDTNKNITLINKKGCEVFGYSEAEMIGKNWYDNFSDEDNKQRGAKEFAKLMANKNKKIQYNESFVRNKNGEKRLIAWHDINMLDNHENAIGLLSSGEDITERKQLENELLKAKEMADNANNAKSIFLANMSHEIRTPMNAIIGFSNILVNMVQDNTQKKFLESIQSSGKTLLNIINDVLEISKIEAGKIEIKNNAVSLTVLADELESMFSIKMIEKGLSFNKIMDASIPEYIEIDELRLRQVLINLLSNAIKFTESGYISLELKADIQSKNIINLIVHVKDTGIGISKESQKKIFESFQQTEEHDYRIYGGTGLGLSISKKMIELLGGNITLSSTVNKGSVFTINLPNIKIPKKSNVVLVEKHKHKPENLTFKKASILVVDDIKDNRDVVIGYLKDYNFIITEAIDGQQAVDKAIEQLPDLILMDLRMPKMNGYEATQRLKNNEKTLHIPIVALTASAYINTKEEFALKGFDGYIRKPMHIIELVNEISRFIEFNETEAEKPAIKEAEIDIPENLSDKLADIIEELETIMSENLIFSQNRQTIKGVKLFNTQIIEMNKAYDIPFLNKYTSNIKDALSSFDVANIKTLVLKFPDIINSLKNILSGKRI